MRYKRYPGQCRKLSSSPLKPGHSIPGARALHVMLPGSESDPRWAAASLTHINPNPCGRKGLASVRAVLQSARRDGSDMKLRLDDTRNGATKSPRTCMLQETLESTRNSYLRKWARTRVVSHLLGYLQSGSGRVFENLMLNSSNARRCQVIDVTCGSMRQCSSLACNQTCKPLLQAVLSILLQSQRVYEQRRLRRRRLGLDRTMRWTQASVFLIPNVPIMSPQEP